MKRLSYILLLTVSLVISCTSCVFTPLSSIENTLSIRVIGIDIEDSLIKLTLVAETTKSSEDGEESDSSSTLIYTAYGETVFDALRSCHAFTNQHVFLGHMTFLVIGEPLAKQGMGVVMDHFSREHSIHLTANVLLAKGSTANELITKVDTSYMPLEQKLFNLIDEKDALSQAKELTIIQYMQRVSTDKKSLILPCVYLDNHTKKEDSKDDMCDLALNGYGLFNDDILVDYAQGDTARAFNFLMNKVDSGIIIVKEPTGSPISMEIIDADTKIETEYINDNIEVNVKVQFSTNIGEVTSTNRVFNDEMFDYLEKQQNQMIKEQLTTAVKLMQDTNTDAAGIGNLVYNKYPVIWNENDIKWEDIFPDIDISVNVESKINRSYNISDPINYKGGK